MEQKHPRNLTKVILVILLINFSFAFIAAAECNDGQDNDGDNKTDALVEVDAPTGSETKSWYKDPFGIRDFVNSKATEYGFTPVKATYIWASALNYDSITADFVCELAGYETATDLNCVSKYDGGRCGWYSPSDNSLTKWIPSINNFRTYNARDLDNTWLTTLTCKDKIVVSECNDGIDNDEDGNTDYPDDNGCASIYDNSEIAHDPDCDSPTDDDESSPSECSINTDCSSQNDNSTNMCDGNTVYYNTYKYTYSCSSEECESDGGTRVDVEDCTNGCQDGQCIDQQPACSDGEDNDNDGKVDLLDPGCWNIPGNILTYNPNLNSEIDCNDNSDCGSDNYIPGTETCASPKGNQTAYHSYNRCENAGENNAQCSYRELSITKQDCGTDSSTVKTQCIGNSLRIVKTDYNVGCAQNSCFNNSILDTIIISCAGTCSNGQCDDYTDETDPTINLQTPINGSTVNGVLDFNYTATDESGIANCTLIINNTNQQTSTSINEQINTFVQALNQTGQHYTAQIGCFDYLNNYGISNKITFYYSQTTCEVTENCGTYTENIICRGDDVVKEIITPLCQDSACATNITHELIKECNDGCLNGHCKSDKKKRIDDNIPPIINTSPLVQLFNKTRPMSLILGNTILGDKNVQNIDWIYVLLFLLFAGIIFLFLLIFYVALK